MAKQERPGGKKGRKIGRDKEKCARYRIQGRREINKIRKVRKHIRRHPNDIYAEEALKETISGRKNTYSG
jgi:ribosomal protein S15P/S13E